MPKVMRWDAKRDENEPEIIEALEAVGASVARWDDVDLVVGFRGKNYLFEVKTEKGRLNKKQAKFFRSWNGQVNIVRTRMQALKLIGAI